MAECPTPVLVVSGVSRRGAAATLQALRRGAVDFILKYTAGADTDPEALRRELVGKVRLAARVKVIRSLTGSVVGGRTNGCDTSPPPPALAANGAARPEPRSPWHVPPVVVIGASTGGPVALRELLGALPKNFAAAVVVVQHMPATFTRVLAAQLDRQIGLAVREAADGDRLRAGGVLVAPGDYHMLLQPQGRVELVRGPRIGGHCPSIDVTMQSAAQAFGPRASGVVLTGMGSDGALGLLAVRGRGGRTYAQDAASCVVNGMPQQAIDRGAAERVAPPVAIARLLQERAVRTAEELTW
jgi:two-component system chemotaxis response regulator CheB